MPRRRWKATAASGDENRELLSYHLALAGILILRGQLDEADQELIRARQLARSPRRRRRNPRAERGAPPRGHARLDALRVGRRESMAEKARQAWSELYALQQRGHLTAEQARTCYYLSRLALLRWQREVRRQAAGSGVMIRTTEGTMPAAKPTKRTWRASAQSATEYVKKRSPWTAKIRKSGSHWPPRSSGSGRPSPDAR